MNPNAQNQWEPVVLRKPGAGPRSSGGAGGANKPPGFRPGDKKMGAGTNRAGPNVNSAAIERNLFAPSKTVGSEFGKALTAARTAKNLTRKQVSEAVRVPYDIIASYESGNGKPDSGIIAKLNRFFGITLPKCAQPKKALQECYDDEM